jgi:TolB protein
MGGLLSWSVVCCSGELSGHRILITSVCTGNTEVFVVDPDVGDAQNLTHSPKSEDRYLCWSPDGKWISLRVIDNAFWRNSKLMAQTYAEKHGDKHPVWVIGADP